MAFSAYANDDTAPLLPLARIGGAINGQFCSGWMGYGVGSVVLRGVVRPGLLRGQAEVTPCLL